MVTKRNLITSLVIIAALIILVIILLATGAENESGQLARGVSTNRSVESYELDVATAGKRELPVYSVAREDKKIALTIDAAWEDDKTEFILEELAKNEIKATFFLCGFWVEKYPDKVKAISDAGHEIGNHSSTHPHMNSMSASQIQKDLNDFETLLESVTGKRTKNFRAPYGEYNDTVIKTVRSMGYEVIQWSIDTVDWREERSAQTILDGVLPKLTPGCIILCHNNGYKIKEYLPVLISTALEQGYEFVTVGELLLEGSDTIIDVNGVQRHGNK